MKTKMIFIGLIMSLTTMVKAFETCAVTNFSCTGLHATPEIASKLARLELVKIEKYTVLDEFDMSEALKGDDTYNDCYGKSCLISLGEKLKTDYVLSGSIDGLGVKIVVSLKLIDVRNKSIKYTKSMEFDNQEAELQRMIAIVIQEMHGIAPDPIIKTRLQFKNEVITSNNVGRMNNSGPRTGVSYVGFGDMNKFFTRKESQGGLEILPLMTNLGYQFEAQYIGTENFSALGELIFNVGGMEQGQFIPSLSLLNGFRFGSSGWEFAFGPSIGIRKTSKGIYDNGRYYRDYEWENKSYNEWAANPNNVDPITGEVLVSFVQPNSDLYKRHLDKRGATELNASWIISFGRPFKSGALNIPVNIYYSSNKFGGVLGASIGFNVTKSKSSINKK